MSSRFCLLLAMLVVLLAPGESYGYELDGNAGSAVFVATGSPVSEALTVDKQSNQAEECATRASPLGLTVFPYSTEGDLCASPVSSFEVAIDGFHHAQAEKRRLLRLKHKRERRERIAKRRAERRARLMQCAKYIAKEYAAEGQARLPLAAPPAVQEVICAANEIDSFPYSWGGGHESDFAPSGNGENGGPGYDCSGSVSYALHKGGFLTIDVNSVGLETWGEEGEGRWITVYASATHAWMVVAGVRFDTREPPDGETGPRWHSTASSPEGFIARHPSGY
jgi:cell wall-associated NlpC family hydrolase